MASKYEITPLSSNKPILQVVKEIEKYLKNNDLYKVYFIDASYIEGTIIYNVEDVKLSASQVLTTNDIVLFDNSYFAVVDAVGETTFTIQNAVNFKGDKGDTGATGETGATGNGISSVVKTGTSGLVDTYTITFTNGNTSTFDVTNGEKGDTGATGQTGATGNGIVSIAKTGTTGLTDVYTITYSNGNSTTYNVTNGKGISSITKTSTSGLVDTYTISYNDGTDTTFDVTNGKDGTNGQTTLYKHIITLTNDSNFESIIIYDNQNVNYNSLGTLTSQGYIYYAIVIRVKPTGDDRYYDAVYNQLGTWFTDFKFCYVDKNGTYQAKYIGNSSTLSDSKTRV